MKHQIETNLKELHLSGMARSWQTLCETRQAQELSFSEGLQILLHSEMEERQNNRFDRLLKAAKFRYQASVPEINFDPSRGLDKGLLTELTSCQYIEKGEAVLITGATGSGKSFLASALGHQACVNGYKVMYFNTQKFMIRLKMARLEGNVLNYFDKLAKSPLLILDDFGLTHLEKQQQFDLMEIMEDRHGRASTIIASQLPVASWYDVISDATIADAILDRLIHTSHRFELLGDTLRKKRK